MTRGPSIVFDHVSLTLGNTRILEDVSFTLAAGRIHCLIGPNGGGKTSLMRSVLGQMPHAGVIDVRWQSGTAIGYVPQYLDFDRSLPITVTDFIAMACQRRPAFLGPSRPTRSAMEAALERVGLRGKRLATLGSLSGGERQRVLVAQALLPAPDLLLLDEPMTGLDDAGAQIFEAIVKQESIDGVTVLWIAHDLAQVARIADSVTCLKSHVLFHGKPAEVLTDQALAEAFRAGLAAARPDMAVGAR